VAVVRPGGTTVLVDSQGEQPLFERCGALAGSKDEFALGASWSPDGAEVACVAGDGTLLISDLKNERQLAGPGTCEAAVSWAPGNQTLACRGQTAVNVVDVHSGRRVVLPPAQAVSWLRSDRLVLEQMAETHLYDSGGRRIATLPPVRRARILVDHDASRAAYTTGNALLVVDLTTGAISEVGRELTPLGWLAGDGGLLVRDPGGSSLTVDLAGTALQRLTGVAHAISRSGRFAAVSREVDGKDALFIVELATGVARPIPGATYNPFRPGGGHSLAFSPDESRICWLEGGAGAYCAGGLSRAPTLNRLEYGAPQSSEPGSALRAFDDAFSHLAYTERTPGALNLLIVSVDGSGVPNPVGSILGPDLFAWRP
jgi:hypothetical protein